MRWVTRDYVHFDRVATPWLIKRFIDPEAEFIFVPWGQEATRPADAIPYAMPGIPFSDPHDGTASTFLKVMRAYNLDTAPLRAMAELVEIGVAYCLRDEEPPLGKFYGELVDGVMALAVGFMLLSESDEIQIERSFVLFDALYEVFRMYELMVARGDEPKGNEEMWRTVSAYALAALLRPGGRAFAEIEASEIGPEFGSVLAQMRGNAAAMARVHQPTVDARNSTGQNP